MSFPPLASAVVLQDAPESVARLLERRWMARLSRPDDAAADDFVVSWRSSDFQLEEPTGVEVRWRGDSGGGSLVNRAGRVRPLPDSRSSIVELGPAALEDEAGIETLLEASLANALVWRGECFLHAGAIRFRNRTALIVGESGAGKSTLAAAVASSGGQIVSDDSLLLGRDADRPRVRAARRNAWLRPGSKELEPRLARLGLELETGPDGRACLSRDRYPKAFLESARPTCLLHLSSPSDVPRVAAEPMDQARALSELLRGTSALYVTDDRFAKQRERLIGLLTLYAEELPAATVRFGTSLLTEPEECLAALDAALP